MAGVMKIKSNHYNIHWLLDRINGHHRLLNLMAGHKTGHLYSKSTTSPVKLAGTFQSHLVNSRGFKGHFFRREDVSWSLNISVIFSVF